MSKGKKPKPGKKHRSLAALELVFRKGAGSGTHGKRGTAKNRAERRTWKQEKAKLNGDSMTTCEAGLFRPCGKSPAKKCSCCGLYLCSKHLCVTTARRNGPSEENLVALRRMAKESESAHERAAATKAADAMEAKLGPTLARKRATAVYEQALKEGGWGIVSHWTGDMLYSGKEFYAYAGLVDDTNVFLKKIPSSSGRWVIAPVVLASAAARSGYELEQRREDSNTDLFALYLVDDTFGNFSPPVKTTRNIAELTALAESLTQRYLALGMPESTHDEVDTSEMLEWLKWPDDKKARFMTDPMSVRYYRKKYADTNPRYRQNPAGRNFSLRNPRYSVQQSTEGGRVCWRILDNGKDTGKYFFSESGARNRMGMLPGYDGSTSTPVVAAPTPVRTAPTPVRTASTYIPTPTGAAVDPTTGIALSSSQRYLLSLGSPNFLLRYYRSGEQTRYAFLRCVDEREARKIAAAVFPGKEIEVLPIVKLWACWQGHRSRGDISYYLRKITTGPERPEVDYDMYAHEVTEDGNFGVRTRTWAGSFDRGELLSLVKPVLDTPKAAPVAGYYLYTLNEWKENQKWKTLAQGEKQGVWIDLINRNDPEWQTRDESALAVAVHAPTRTAARQIREDAEGQGWGGQLPFNQTDPLFLVHKYYSVAEGGEYYTEHNYYVVQVKKEAQEDAYAVGYKVKTNERHRDGSASYDVTPIKIVKELHWARANSFFRRQK